MLRAEKFSEELHGKILQRFAELHNVQAPLTKFLSPTGYVIYFNMKPICLGFMVKCDNRTAIYQDFLSDPGAPKDMRNKCTDALRAFLDKEAIEADIQVILCATTHTRHVERLKGLGYQVLHSNLTELGRFLWL